MNPVVDQVVDIRDPGSKEKQPQFFPDNIYIANTNCKSWSLVL